MSTTDKKDGPAAVKSARKSARKTPGRAARKSASPAASAAAGKPAVRASERLINLLLAPHVSEKAARAGEKHNQYVFRVRPEASKPEIARAVELMFSVEVDAVQVVNVAGKKKRFGATFGRRSDWKKAYVSLKTGQTIDLTGTAKT